MHLLDRLRTAFARRTPDEPSVTRRHFLAGAAGLGLAVPALAAASTPEGDAAWAAIERRAAQWGITPGTVVDARGRPVRSNALSSDPLIASISMFGGNFAPRGWAMCDGQLLPISQYTALFSLVGTVYGGDGRTTFGLPDLRGRFPMHAGAGPGLSNRSLGQRSGQESVTLTPGQMPNHAHALPTVQVRGAGTQTTGLAEGASRASANTEAAGGNQAHDNMPPWLAVTFVIALEGLYPSRN
jgi:microcystin-dependent protein